MAFIKRKNIPVMSENGLKIVNVEQNVDPETVEIGEIGFLLLKKWSNILDIYSDLVYNDSECGGRLRLPQKKTEGKEFFGMKKTYQSPECQAILLADDDILTTSFTEVSKNDGEGDFENGGAVITW